MKIFLLATLLAISVPCAFAQTEVKVWTVPIGKNDYDDALAVTTDLFGNVILASGSCLMITCHKKPGILLFRCAATAI
jgi:hypothetical protein